MNNVAKHRLTICRQTPSDLRSGSREFYLTAYGSSNGHGLSIRIWYVYIFSRSAQSTAARTHCSPRLWRLSIFYRLTHRRCCQFHYSFVKKPVRCLDCACAVSPSRPHFLFRPVRLSLRSTERGTASGRGMRGCRAASAPGSALTAPLPRRWTPDPIPDTSIQIPKWLRLQRCRFRFTAAVVQHCWHANVADGGLSLPGLLQENSSPWLPLLATCPLRG